MNDKEGTLKSKYISTKEAQQMAKNLGINISIMTVITWVENYDLGHQLGGKGGKWAIDREKWEQYITHKCDTNGGFFNE